MIMKGRLMVRAIALSTLLLVGSSVFAVNGLFDFGFSEITRGMAGSGSALPQDSIIAAINPAGMVEVGTRADLGAAFYFPDFYYNASPGTPICNPITGCAIEIAPYRHQDIMSLFVLPDAGFNWMINPKSSLGVSLYSLGGFGTTYADTGYATLPPPPFGPGPSIGVFGGGTQRDQLRQGVTSFTYSRFIGPTTSIGISLLTAVQTFESEGSRQLAPLSVAPQNITDHTDYSVGAGIRAGILGNWLPYTSFSASFQPIVPMTRFKIYRGLLQDGGSLDLPANGTVGVAVNVMPNLVFTGDILEIWFDTVKALANPEANLGICAAGDPTYCLGGINGAGFGWDNLVAYKVGVQWAATPWWVFRAGYNHADTAVHGNELLTNILAPGAIIEDIVTLGLTHYFHFKTKNAINLFLVYIPQQHLSGLNEFSGGAQSIRLTTSGIGGGLSWSWLFGT